MDDADRERELRRLERDRRRQERGKPSYFEAWPLPEGSEAPTMIIRREALEEDQLATQDTVMLPPAEPAGRGSGLAVSTAIFGLATALSRVLGLVREVVAASYFGASGKINAFTVAFQIPNLVRALVADAALSSAFVPVFSELLEKGERKRA